MPHDNHGAGEAMSDARLINGAFDPIFNHVDPEFDAEDFRNMMHFGLHDERDVRALMDLPSPMESKHVW